MSNIIRRWEIGDPSPPEGLPLHFSSYEELVAGHGGRWWIEDGRWKEEGSLDGLTRFNARSNWVWGRFCLSSSPGWENSAANCSGDRIQIPHFQSSAGHRSCVAPQPVEPTVSWRSLHARELQRDCGYIQDLFLCRTAPLVGAYRMPSESRV